MSYQRKRTLGIEKEQEIKCKIMEVLDESPEALTLEQIQQRDMMLHGYTTQKLSRLISGLIEMGCVRKARSSALGRMVYKSTTVMQVQGYDVGDEEEEEDLEDGIPDDYVPQGEKHQYPHYKYVGNQWIIDGYICLEDLTGRRV